MYVGDNWREPRSKKTYISAKKEVDPSSCSKEDLASWVLAGKVEDEFQGEPATVAEILYKVTQPLSLSSYDTIELIKKAKDQGFLEVVKKRRG